MGPLFVWKSRTHAAVTGTDNGRDSKARDTAPTRSYGLVSEEFRFPVTY